MPRNSSGTYTLPAGNPVVPNTLIDTNWANPTMSDLGAAITDSLDRFGRGGMLAQLKLADGTLTQPAFAFNSESSTGLLRPSAGVFQVAVLGALIASFSATGTLFALAPSYAADPVSANQLARKSYVDAQIGTGLPLTGGVMTAPGNITSPGTFTALGFTSTGAAIIGQQGSVGSPGFTFVGDTNTGLWSPAADVLSMSLGGVDVFRLNAVGAGFGIAPTDSLSLGGRIIDSVSGGYFRQSGNAANYVAIGTVAGAGLLTTGFNGPLDFGINNVGRMRLDGGGNLGLGTTSLLAAMEILRGAAVTCEFVLRGNGNTYANGFTINQQASNQAAVFNRANADMFFGTNSLVRYRITAAGLFLEESTGFELGYKDIPRTTGGLTRGLCFATAAGVTVNTSSAGATYSIYNDSAANITITQGAMTLRLNGTATTGNRTLLARGFATIWFNAAAEAVISGAIT